MVQFQDKDTICAEPYLPFLYDQNRFGLHNDHLNDLLTLDVPYVLRLLLLTWFNFNRSMDK